jgi:hypothetical protein
LSIGCLAGILVVGRLTLSVDCLVDILVVGRLTQNHIHKSPTLKEREKNHNRNIVFKCFHLRYRYSPIVSHCILFLSINYSRVLTSYTNRILVVFFFLYFFVCEFSRYPTDKINLHPITSSKVTDTRFTPLIILNDPSYREEKYVSPRAYYRFHIFYTMTIHDTPLRCSSIKKCFLCDIHLITDAVRSCSILLPNRMWPVTTPK